MAGCIARSRGRAGVVAIAHPTGTRLDPGRPRGGSGGVEDGARRPLPATARPATDSVPDAVAAAPGLGTAPHDRVGRRRDRCHGGLQLPRRRSAARSNANSARPLPTGGRRRYRAELSVAGARRGRWSGQRGSPGERVAVKIGQVVLGGPQDENGACDRAGRRRTTVQQQQRRPVATMPDAELCRTHVDVLGDETFDMAGS